jgi:acyl carrier protein
MGGLEPLENRYPEQASGSSVFEQNVSGTCDTTRHSWLCQPVRCPLGEVSMGKRSVKRMTTDPSESSAAEVRYTAPTTPTERFFSKVLAEIMGIEQVSVDSHFFDDLGADSMVMARFCARVRKREDLPPVSMKEVYQHPTIKSLAAAVTVADPSTPTEQFFSEVLAEIMGIEQVSVDSHFFNDLGADSMVMARFCARVRKREDLPPVSIKEVYEHPSIISLAAALTDTGRAPAPAPESATARAKAVPPVGTSQYFMCGALQFLSALG